MVSGRKGGSNLRRIELILLCGLGGFVVTWYGGPGIILGVDSYFVLSPQIAVHEALRSWSTLTSAGLPNFQVQTLFFYALFAGLLDVFGYRVAQTIVLWSLISASALGMRAVLRSLFSWDEPSGAVAIIAASALYAFNPFTTSYLWWHQLWLEFTWASFPFLIAFTISVGRGRLSPLFAAAMGMIVLLLAAPGYPHVLLVPLSAFIIVLALALITGRNNWRSTALHIGAVLASWAIALAWWIVPSIVFLRDFLAAWHAQYKVSPLYLLQYGSQFSSWANVLRLTGLIQLHEAFYTQPFFPWFTPFNDTSLGDVLYALPALAFAGSVITFWRFKRAQPQIRNALIAFAASGFVASFLMKGDQPPWAFINVALLSLPLGAAWQHPYDKFALVEVIGACVMASLALRTILTSITPQFWKIIGVATIVVVVFIEGLPAYAGVVLTPQTNKIPGGVAVVPPYYKGLAQYLRGDGMLLQLPMRDNGETAFSWPRGAQTNNDPILEDFDRGDPVIRMRTGSKYADALLSEGTTALGLSKGRDAALSALGFEGAIVHNDWNSQFFPMLKGPLYYDELLGPTETPESGGAELITTPSSQGLKLPLDGLNMRDLTISMFVKVRAVSRNQTIVSTDNGFQVRWLEPGYVAVQGPMENGTSNWIHTAGLPINSNRWFLLSVQIRNGETVISIDGNSIASGKLLLPKRAKSVFLGSANRFLSFRGSFADVSILRGKQPAFFLSSEDPVLRARAHLFDWTIGTAFGRYAAPPAGSAVLESPHGANGLKVAEINGDSRDVRISFYFRPTDLHRGQVLLATDSGITLRWIEPGYLGLSGTAAAGWVHSPALDLAPNSWEKIGLVIKSGRATIDLNDTTIASGRFQWPRTRAIFLGSATKTRNLVGSASDFHVDSAGAVKSITKFTRSLGLLLSRYGWHFSGTIPRVGNSMTFQRIGALSLFTTSCPTGPVYIAHRLQSVAANSDVLSTLAAGYRCGSPLAVTTKRRLAIPNLSGNAMLAGSPRHGALGFNAAVHGNGVYLLVMNSSFSRKWVATSTTGRSKVLRHFVVNGYANGYVIQAVGNDVIALRYSEQPLIWRSLLAGAIVLLLAIAGLIYEWRLKSARILADQPSLRD